VVLSKLRQKEGETIDGNRTLTCELQGLAGTSLWESRISGTCSLKLGGVWPCESLSCCWLATQDFPSQASFCCFSQTLSPPGGPSPHNWVHQLYNGVLLEASSLGGYLRLHLPWHTCGTSEAFDQQTLSRSRLGNESSLSHAGEQCHGVGYARAWHILACIIQTNVYQFHALSGLRSLCLRTQLCCVDVRTLDEGEHAALLRYPSLPRYVPKAA